MADLFKTCFPKSLKELRTLITKKKVQKQQNLQNQDYYDSLLGLLAVSVKNDQNNVVMLIKKDLLPIITDILQDSQPLEVRYLHLLSLIIDICETELPEEIQNPANFFCEKYLYKNLINDIKVTYYIYKRTNEISQNIQIESPQRVILMYKTFSMQIQCLAALLNSDNNRATKVLNSDPIIMDLLQICSNFKTDPLILTAVCQLALKVLNINSVKESKKLLSQAINQLSSCEHLVPYLGL